MVALANDSASEDVDVVLKTARACCHLDYPADRFRIIVADDGANREIKNGVDVLRKTHNNIYYYARMKPHGIPHHAKAGNLVAATAFSDMLAGGPSEFLACLDADMIVVKDWLRAIVAHHIDDPKLGLACPPQVCESTIARIIINKVSAVLQCARR